ncbi:hypothetical protein MASR2M47_28560 [Draconibacterium sp.]
MVAYLQLYFPSAKRVKNYNLNYAELHTDYKNLIITGWIIADSLFISRPE